MIIFHICLQVTTPVDRDRPIEEQLVPHVYLLGVVVSEELGLAR